MKEKINSNFVNREEIKKIFLQILNNKKQKILHIHGERGIGKTALQEYLIENYLENKENIIFAKINFEVKEHRSPELALRKLVEALPKSYTHSSTDTYAKSMSKKLKITFNAFMLAYTIYLKKINPDIKLEKRKIPYLDDGEGNLIGSIISNFDGGITTSIKDTISYGYSKLPNFLPEGTKKDLENLESLDILKISEKLSMFFAKDLNKYIKEYQIKNCVIFFDSYDNLKNDIDNNGTSHDRWVKNFISQCIDINNILFVISSKNTLKKSIFTESSWKEYIYNYELSPFSNIASKELLKHCNIQKQDIQEYIILQSQSIPYYLNIYANEYNKAKRPELNFFKTIVKDKNLPDYSQVLNNKQKEQLIWRKILDFCNNRSDKHLENIYGKGKYIEELFIERKNITDSFNNFFKSDKTGFVLVGSSGVGKTNIVCNFFDILQKHDYLTLFLNSSQMLTTLDIESIINNELDLGKDIKEVFAYINNECEKRGKNFVILIDAINEFHTGDGKGPLDLMKKIDSIISKNPFPYIKYIITSRTRAWRSINSSYDFNITEKFYYLENSNDEKAHIVSKFTQKEVRFAYSKYKNKFNLKSDFSDLLKIVQNEISDPLILRLTSEVYVNRTIPREPIGSEIFDKYFQLFIYDKKTKNGNKTLQKFLYDLVDIMLSINKDNIYVDSDEDKLKKYPLLYNDLIKEKSSYTVLLDKGILTESDINEDRLIKFTYDRFFEFILSKVLIRELNKKLKKSTSNTWINQQNIIIEFIINYLNKVSNFTILWGSIANIILYMSEKKVFKFIRGNPEKITSEETIQVIYSLATHSSPYALSLVSLCIEKLALKNIDFLDITSNFFIKKQIKTSNSAIAVLIESFYTILTSEQYRISYLELDKNEKNKHDNVLYKIFIYGMEQEPGSISNTTIQYIYFLWSYDMANNRKWEYYKNHAEKIIQIISTPSSSYPTIEAIKLFSKRKRNNLQNLFGLYLLILAKNCNEFEKIENIIDSIKSVFRNYPLNIMHAVLNTMFKYIFKLLPNPINMEEMKSVFEDEKVKQDFIKVMKLLDPNNEALHLNKNQVFFSMLETKNSFIYQMLTHALSTNFHKYNESNKQNYFNLIDDLFTNKETVSKYVAEIAIYHINYFGEKYELETIEKMKKMASVILKEHKGRFTVKNKEYDFNVIGTYGRVLIRHSKILEESTLKYIIDSLEYAKSQNDNEYYLYICDNLKLLGTLESPRKVLESMKYILEDIEEIDVNDDRIINKFEYYEIKDKIIESLAVIRIRYKSIVDDFLLNVVDDDRLFKAVLQKKVKNIGIHVYYSWTFEELFEKTIIYYPEIASKIIKIFIDSAEYKNMNDGISTFTMESLNTLIEFSKNKN